MYIGIDLGGTNIAVGVVDKEGKILHKDSIETETNRHYTEIIKYMASLAKKVIFDAGLKDADIEWIGIGSPGSCDSTKGVITRAANLNFKNVPIISEFKKHFNAPTFLANDADCAAYGEAVCGGAKGTKNSVTVTLGTGVGGGVIIDGKILRGINFGSELGHTIVNFDGLLCKCGKVGCWEMYASATALKRQTRDAMKENKNSLLWKEAGSLENVSGKTAFDAAKKGDKVAETVVDNYLRYVAVGVYNIIEIFQPEVVLIGGGISKEGERILEPIRRYSSSNVGTVIKTATLGNDAGIIGAAFLGRA